MKILCLDLGDAWTGSAISDPLGILAIPYETVPAASLEEFLVRTIEKEGLRKIVIGYPKTMRGTISAQTQKIIDKKKELEEKFKDIEWVLWDERLSSKRAGQLKKTKTKEEKIKSHSIAAAFILESYLEYLQAQKH